MVRVIRHAMFRCDDPFLFGQQLTQEECMILEATPAYAHD